MYDAKMIAIGKKQERVAFLFESQIQFSSSDEYAFDDAGSGRGRYDFHEFEASGAVERRNSASELAAAGSYQYIDVVKRRRRGSLRNARFEQDTRPR
jgi:hypothetical protein